MSDLKQYIVASFSGGKDSTAMVLKMIELGEHIDEVINVDTGMEFPPMYDHIERVRNVIESHGIKFTVLKGEHSFDWYLLNIEINGKNGIHHGYGWPTARFRWCTSFFKRTLVSKYLKELKQKYDVIQCIGLASDETDRLEREYNKNPKFRHPLADWGMTEADCLRYCYDHGYDWDGLYEKFNRVSCWCCPLAPIGELYKLYRYYPELWTKLEKWDEKILAEGIGYGSVMFKGKHSVSDLTRRFEKRAKSEEQQSSLDRWL